MITCLIRLNGAKDGFTCYSLLRSGPHFSGSCISSHYSKDIVAVRLSHTFSILCLMDADVYFTRQVCTFLLSTILGSMALSSLIS